MTLSMQKKNKNLLLTFLKKIKTYKRLETDVFLNQTRQDDVHIRKEFAFQQANMQTLHLIVD